MQRKLFYMVTAVFVILSLSFEAVFAAAPIREEAVSEEELFLEPNGEAMDFDTPELMLQSSGGGSIPGGVHFDGGGAAPGGGGIASVASGEFEPSTWHYGKETLSKLSSGEYLVQIYEKLNDAIANFEPEIDVSDLLLEPTVEYENLLYTIWMAIHGDHPEYFWLNPVKQGFSYEYYEGEQYIETLEPYYTFEQDEREVLKRQKAEAERMANSWIAESGVRPSDSFYQKTKKIHDLICNKVSYDYSAKQPLLEHTIYDTLMKQTAVCDGYVTTYQYLLSKVGVDSHFIGGYSNNPVKQEIEQHAWNLLRNGENYCFSDITWNDQDTSIFYDYFNRTGDFMEESFHIIKMPYEIPSADDDSQSYYAQKENSDICVKSTKDIPIAIQAVIKQFKNGEQFARIYFDVPLKETELYWMLFRSGGKTSGTDGVKEIAKGLGMSGSINYAHSYMCKEYHFLFYPGMATAKTKEGKSVLCVTCPKGNFLLSIGYYAPWLYTSKWILSGYRGINSEFSVAGTRLYEIPSAAQLPVGTQKIKFMLWDGYDNMTPQYKSIEVSFAQ